MQSRQIAEDTDPLNRTVGEANGVMSGMAQPIEAVEVEIPVIVKIDIGTLPDFEVVPIDFNDRLALVLMEDQSPFLGDGEAIKTAPQRLRLKDVLGNIAIIR